MPLPEFVSAEGPAGPALVVSAGAAAVVEVCGEGEAAVVEVCGEGDAAVGDPDELPGAAETESVGVTAASVVLTGPAETEEVPEEEVPEEAEVPEPAMPRKCRTGTVNSRGQLPQSLWRRLS